MRTRISAQKGTVYLVGAGPGDPDLLTLRAADLLETADLVLHDDLVPEPVLAMCGERTLLNSVGKRCGRPRITQAGIHALMIESAKQNLSVIRLKSGDPLVFGRAAEELAALHQANIPVEIVPGISAVFAAGASMQLPLTDRRSASKLILIAGQHAADKEDRAPLWKGTLPEDATLAIYMPGRTPALIAAELARAGVSPQMPCVAISKAATPQQQVTASRLEALSNLEFGAAPLLLLVGHAMECMLHANAPVRERLATAFVEQAGICL